MLSALASAGMLPLISFTRQSGERLELVPGESEQLLVAERFRVPFEDALLFAANERV